MAGESDVWRDGLRAVEDEKKEYVYVATRGHDFPLATVISLYSYDKGSRRPFFPRPKQIYDFLESRSNRFRESGVQILIDP